MFPELKFVLVDPARFAAYDVPGKVKVINDYFTDDIAREYAGRDDILFISDIRSMSIEMNEKLKEERVEKDMDSQMKWHRIINPHASMLKFRLPYPPPDGKTNYLKGHIYLPVWGGRTTTETRLIVTREPDHFDAEKKEPKTMDYSHSDYESVMFNFNTVTRTTYFEHDIVGEGLDHCFDCASEIFILRNYLRKIKNLTDEQVLNRQIANLSKLISREISKKGRTLLLWDSSPRRYEPPTRKRGREYQNDWGDDQARKRRRLTNEKDEPPRMT